MACGIVSGLGDRTRYLHPGGVLVPAYLARPVLELLVQGLARESRAAGGAVPTTEFMALLDDLHATDLASDGRAVSDFGPVESAPASVEDMRTPDKAGGEGGLSGRHVRRLCAAGVVTHRRIGARGYLVDVHSLRAHLRGEGKAAAS